MDPESINSVCSLFDCFGAILHEFTVLITGLKDPVYESDDAISLCSGIGVFKTYEFFMLLRAIKVIQHLSFRRVLQSFRVTK